MPYWEMLGRAVVTLASKSVSEEISEYLTYSGLDATVSYDQDSDCYIVSVPLAQENTAERLMENYPDADPEENQVPEIDFLHNRVCSPAFVRAEDKFKDTTGSALIFLFAGSLVFVLAIAHCVLVLLDYRKDSSSGCLIELALGALFLGFGLYTLRKANEIKGRIQEENEYITHVIEWCVSTYPASQIDMTVNAATEGIALSPEDRYFLRKDLLRCYIIREFNVEDPSYLEYLTEETYISIFEKKKLQQKKTVCL